MNKDKLLTCLKDWFDYAREDRALNVIYPEDKQAYKQIVAIIKKSGQVNGRRREK